MTIESIRHQIAEIEKSLSLIRERKSEFVQKTTIPLQLIKDEDQLESELANLKTALSRLHNSPNPYRGLKPFDVDHADYYFGRDSMVNKLLAKMNETGTNFIAVVGASGSGKSSLIQAGLKKGITQQGHVWHVIGPLRPDSKPLSSLAHLLVTWLHPNLGLVEQLDEAHKLADYLRQGKESIGDLRSLLRNQVSQPDRLVLVVDQFEDIFVKCENNESELFLSTLLELNAADVPWFVVVVALRTELFGRVLQHGELGRRVDTGLVNVLRMSEKECWAAIEQPAVKADRSFEKGLVQRIVDALESQPGYLPLLQFALTELWDQQTVGGVLTHAAYDDIGGVGGAIAKRADKFLNTLKEPEQVPARAIFTRLIRIAMPNDETKDSLHRIKLNEFSPSSQRLVNDLVDARLLVSDQDSQTGEIVVEIAHEALISNWGKLQKWLEADREFLLWRQKLKNYQSIWLDRNQDPEELLQSKSLLIEGSEWASQRMGDLDESEQMFLFCSALEMEFYEHTFRNKMVMESKYMPQMLMNIAQYKSLTVRINLAKLLFTADIPQSINPLLTLSLDEPNEEIQNTARKSLAELQLQLPVVVAALRAKAEINPYKSRSQICKTLAILPTRNLSMRLRLWRLKMLVPYYTSWLIKWSVVNSIGWIIGLAVALTVQGVLVAGETVLLPKETIGLMSWAISGFVAGAISGRAQGYVLHEYKSASHKWVFANSVGWAIGCVAGWVVGRSMNLGLFIDWTNNGVAARIATGERGAMAVTIVVAVGLFVGIAQSFIFRHFELWRYLLLTANIIGISIGLSSIAIVISLLGIAEGWSLFGLQGLFVTLCGALGGALYGIVTGIPLFWLLEHSKLDPQ